MDVLLHCKAKDHLIEAPTSLSPACKNLIFCQSKQCGLSVMNQNHLLCFAFASKLFSHFVSRLICTGFHAQIVPTAVGW